MTDIAALRDALAAFEPDVFRGRLPEWLGPVDAQGDAVRVELELPIAAGRVVPALERHLGAALGVRVTVQLTGAVAAQPVQGNLQRLPNIRNIIAVASGKGGVGKSTVAANLALALAADGARVGMLDADIYGPSQPRMLGVEGAKPEVLQEKFMRPVVGHGVHMMSIGLLVDVEQPTIWRGPMVTQALQQMLAETRWPELDYLIIDLPPGTGDTQLSLAQRIPVSGAVVVTTPQDIALLDARKGLRMFEKVGVNILGIVENMSMHVCSNCGHADPIFGSGGGVAMASDYNVPLLGQLPLQADIRADADGGHPTVVARPDSEAAKLYFDMARRTALALANAGVAEFPEIVIED